MDIDSPVFFLSLQAKKPKSYFPKFSKKGIKPASRRRGRNLLFWFRSWLATFWLMSKRDKVPNCITAVPMRCHLHAQTKPPQICTKDNLYTCISTQVIFCGTQILQTTMQKEGFLCFQFLQSSLSYTYKNWRILHNFLTHSCSLSKNLPLHKSQSLRSYSLVTFAYMRR